MDWLSGNWIWVVVVVVMLYMHLGHGGMHGGGRKDEDGRQRHH